MLAPGGLLDRVLADEGYVDTLVAEGGTLDRLVALGPALEAVEPRLRELAAVIPTLNQTADSLQRAVGPLGDLAGRLPTCVAVRWAPAAPSPERPREDRTVTEPSPFPVRVERRAVDEAESRRPTVPTGTPTPTSTRPPTATTSATRASCGDPRA